MYTEKGHLMGEAGVGSGRGDAAPKGEVQVENVPLCRAGESTVRPNSTLKSLDLQSRSQFGIPNPRGDNPGN